MQNRIRVKSYKKALSTSILVIFALSLFVLPVRPALGAPDLTIFSEDFERVFPKFGSWSIGDLNPESTEDYWGATGYRAHSGSKSGWCAQIGTKIVGLNTEDNAVVHEYDDNMDAYMTKQIDLRDYISATLSYHYWLECEYDSDYLHVQTSTDGFTWTTEKSYTGDSADLWVQGTVDLTPHVGSFVNIRFLFHSDDENSSFEGAYVDDIVITVTPTPVGGFTMFANASDILAPWISLGLVALLTVVAFTVVIKKRRG
ncbi:MAG: immune inhibitor A [archaeon]|nr:immune inhibitor A [archaeon]MCP8313322.1 immune inhibitor A [archaeon]